MCGIVGVWSTTSLSANEQKIFDQLLYCDVLRGNDSFGVFAVDNSREVSVYKTAEYSVQGADWWDKKYGEFRNRSVRALVGHNRAATQGKVNDANSHPFTHDHITMVHNGTLRCATPGHEVDSDWLCKQLSTKANDAEVAEFLSNLNGAFALVWWNERTKRLYIARNSERPLAFCFTGGTFYFASESKMLDWILDRNKVYNYTVGAVPSGKLISFDLTYSGKEEMEFPKKEVAYDDDVYGWGASSRRSAWNQRQPEPISHKPTTLTVVRRDEVGTASGSNAQPCLVEIIDWWTIPGQKIRWHGEEVPSMIVKAKVGFLVGPYLPAVGLKEDDVVLICSVPEPQLDALIAPESGAVAPYVYTEVFGSKTQVYIITMQKAEGNKITPTFAAFHNPLAGQNRLRTTIDIDAISSVSAMSGFMGRAHVLRDALDTDWTGVLSIEAIQEATNKKDVVEAKDEELVPCCGRCRKKVTGQMELFAIGSEVVCDTCYLSAVQLTGYS